MESFDFPGLPLGPRQPASAVPLTSTQLAVWKCFMERGTQQSDLRMCAMCVRIDGPLQTVLLSKSIAAVARRHESLRTTIVAGVDGIPVQQIDEHERTLNVIDLTQLDLAAAESEARRIGRKFLDEQIDLSVGPLFDALLLKLTPTAHVFLVALDHIVSDMISIRILRREIWAVYSQLAQGNSPSLPALPIQFPDYAAWQSRAYDTWLREHSQYWRERLAGVPTLQLPADPDVSEADSTSAATTHVPFGRALSDQLREVAGEAPLALVALTLFSSVLSHWCGQQDFALGFVSHGRYGRAQLEGMIGPLARVLILRIQRLPEDTFRDLLQRLTEEYRAANYHQDFGRVMDIVPDCRVNVTFQWTPSRLAKAAHASPDETARLKLRPFVVDPASELKFRNNESSFSFSPGFADSDSGILMSLRYRRSLYSRASMDRFGQRIRRVAAEFARDPGRRVDSVLRDLDS